jgi:hypothetical protein
VASDADMMGPVLLQRGDDGEELLGWTAVRDRFAELIGGAGMPDWYGVPYLLQDLAFLEALRDCRDPSPGLDAGVAAQALATAVYAAAERDTLIDLATFR